MAQHDLAHREHPRHQHHQIHKRQSTAGAGVVTEVIQTVSVVQQIDVDSNGATVSVLLVPATQEISPLSTASTAPATTSAGSTVTNSASTIASAQSPLSLSSGLSATSASTSSHLTPSSFASFTVSSNSTTLISSSSSLSATLSPTLSNSTSLSSSSRSSLTYITSSTSRLSSSSSISPLSSPESFSSSESSTTSSTSSLYSPSSSVYATSTGAGGIAGGATPTGSGTTSSSTSESGSGSGSGSGSPPSTPVIVGSVVSSVAGVAVIFLLLLFIWRWRKRTRTMLPLGSISGGTGAGNDTTQSGGDPPSQPAGGMSERRSLAYVVPAAFASLTGYKRASHRTDRTVSSTAGSERGFYRVSGRKLPSVLQSGGDGYGGGIDEETKGNTLSGSSFYRDSQGFYGGPGPSTQRESGIPIMRPSPARTPVTESGPFSSSPPTLTPPAPRPDLVGRSHPSQDGSHASRFTEEV